LDETSEVFKTAEVFAGHLPLLIELRHYIAEVAAKNCIGFLEYFHYLGKEGYALNHVDLKERLKTRPSFVIFDGLDEIFALVSRDKVTQEIIGFVGEYPQARVLVTSRLLGYQGEALRAADFREYTLEDYEKQKLRSTFDISGKYWYCLDSKALIDEKRVEEAAKELELPPETIRQHYEEIAKEIPLRLSWKAVNPVRVKRFK
jgi:hypothetical protein